MFALNLRMTDQLQEVLKEAVRRPPSAEQIHNQRVSFVYSFMGKSSTMTRPQVERLVEKHEGKTAE